ncbi:outer membrane protein Omp28 [Nonlabens dokdonensis]|jgi:hypothetical protein|uniref:LigB lipoprotein n=2 Tax=Nonlabens dokdonensis TaxID=328515 RepID=L7W9T4_NONDD|nr:Omp28-related outer membrane protein [Nonlabens dokdonensis]AGC76987.1 LigB lipoprotein [Nonlabens dokdonensis DSW-6]PZX36890.1 outer membrane protein Omp28 [Nonlabens dokdonensis]
MKTANFLKMFALFLAIGITSCTSESTDEDGGNNAGLTLSASKTRVYDFSLITFTVMNGNTDVTSSAVISVDGAPISGNSFNVSGVGTKTATAVFNGENTNSLNIDVINPSFSTKALIEDYTGAWCGWCPRISQGIIDLHNTPGGEDVIAVAVHNGDSMEFPLEAQMRSQFGVNGFPTGILNRNGEWNSASAHAMNLTQPMSLLNSVKPLGLAINSSMSGNSVSATIKVGFDLDTENMKLVAMLLENGKVAAQTNYTNNWGGVSTISNFEHNDILRAAFTDVFGDAIPADQQVGGSEYSVTLSANIPAGTNTTDMDIVAFVVDGSGKVVNVQHAEVGANVDFD